MSSIPGLISEKIAALRGNSMRLQAEEDQIPLANFGYTIARRNARDNVLAFFNQTKAGLDDPRKMGPPCDATHTLPHMGKFGCQRAADRASTD